MCFSCQNNYCKTCIKKWTQRGGDCPNKCSNPTFKDVIGRNRLISKFKFKCINGCGAEILFDDIKKHYDSDCPKKEVKPKKRPASQYKPKNINKPKELLDKNFLFVNITENKNNIDFKPYPIKKDYLNEKNFHPAEFLERNKIIQHKIMNFCPVEKLKKKNK